MPLTCAIHRPRPPGACFRVALVLSPSRRLNVFDSTPKGPHIEVLRPTNEWRRSEEHSDDVTCAAPYGRNAVVTGQYTGGLVIWNLSTGRPRRIPSRERMEVDCPPTPMQEYIVFEVAPIESRLASQRNDVAQLVVATTTGIYFWNTKAVLHGKVCVHACVRGRGKTLMLASQ